MKKYKIEHQITINGQRKVFRGNSEREVKLKILEYQDNELKKQNLSVIADNWKEEHFKTLEHNTIAPYKASLNRIVDEYGDRAIESITAQDVNQYLLKLASYGFSRHTVLNDKMIFNMICNYAIVQGYITVNPCTAVKIPKGLSKEHRLPFSEADEQKVNEYKDKSVFGGLMYFLMLSGLRPAEALALSDKDITDEYINVNKAVFWASNKPLLKEPKTDKGNRQVPLITPLKSFLKDKKGVLFPNASGNIMSKSEYERRWRNYKKETGIQSVPYSARHTYATLLFDCGLTPKDAQSILGHSQYQTTMDIYTDIMERRKNDTAQKLDSFILERNKSTHQVHTR